jgi:hypothetical protein
MNDFERAVERAAEATRDAETEAEHGGDGREECEAEAYADTLGRLHQAYVFDGMVMLLAYPYTGVELCVTPGYFEEHFGQRPDIATYPLPQLSSIRRFVIHENVKISCIEKASFAVVA